jgi:hypothetical protein
MEQTRFDSYRYGLACLLVRARTCVFTLLLHIGRPTLSKNTVLP